MKLKKFLNNCCKVGVTIGAAALLVGVLSFIWGSFDQQSVDLSMRTAITGWVVCLAYAAADWRRADMKQVAYITDVSGDWEGIYVDGKLIDEGHSLDPRMVLDAVGVQYDHRETNLKMGSLPENLEDVP